MTLRGETALHLAAKEGNGAIVREILKTVSTPERILLIAATTPEGLTPAAVAVRAGFGECALLLQPGAKVSTPQSDSSGVSSDRITTPGTAESSAAAKRKADSY